MKIGPRAKLLLIAALFLLPIVASVLVYRFGSVRPTANYGELIVPTTITSQPFGLASGGQFSFDHVRGRWAMVASDSGTCPAACVEKLTTLRQVRLALGRNAARVERVFVVDDLRRPGAAAMQPFDGTVIALTPTGMSLPLSAANDRAHIYLVDPRGNVMLRWPAAADRKRMLKDLERLLKASQIG
jgi:cytochrome oxidase Cu insertion factor (SCO1/SenC/PrrC family)